VAGRESAAAAARYQSAQRRT